MLAIAVGAVVVLVFAVVVRVFRLVAILIVVAILVVAVLAIARLVVAVGGRVVPIVLVRAGAVVAARRCGGDIEVVVIAVAHGIEAIDVVGLVRAAAVSTGLGERVVVVVVVVGVAAEGGAGGFGHLQRGGQLDVRLVGRGTGGVGVVAALAALAVRLARRDGRAAGATPVAWLRLPGEVGLEVRGADEVLDVQERGALQPDVDEGSLHAREHAADLAEVDVSECSDGAVAFEVQLGDDAVLDQGNAGLADVDIDDEEVLCHVPGPGGPSQSPGRARVRAVASGTLSSGMARAAALAGCRWLERRLRSAT
ncbi:MAG: hypothetical protein WKG00_39365 [Polyangiaceae bacterium]